MTLTARTKPPSHHKKISGHHHRRNKSYHKPYWPYLPMLAIVLGGLFLNAAWPAHRGVLSYATDVSVQALLDGTNTQRTNNGLGSLALNAKLNQAAQAKANDMVARDYWAHNTPDGQAPWTFFTAAGYNFQTAGENLAYGFDTSANTITGWMNSPGHRANILNTTYLEVGFGIANSANFVGTGPETVVVAEYAEPVGAVEPAQAPTVASAAPAPTSAPAKQAAPAATPAPDTTQPAPVTEQPVAPVSSEPVTVPDDTKLKPVTEEAPVRISRIQSLTAGKAAWSSFVLSIMIAVGFLFFFTRHGIAWHKVLRRGEGFVLHHPVLDIAATAILVACILLTRTAGLIR
jgi:hypothetical protein